MKPDHDEENNYYGEWHKNYSGFDPHTIEKHVEHLKTTHVSSSVEPKTPTPKYKVGDKVIHNLNHDLMGVVFEIHPTGIQPVYKLKQAKTNTYLGSFYENQLSPAPTKITKKHIVVLAAALRDMETSKATKEYLASALVPSLKKI